MHGGGQDFVAGQAGLHEDPPARARLSGSEQLVLSLMGSPRVPSESAH